ncbi:hypothetical protein ACHAW5_002824 [Stephanodiscus triporus]|uniref:Choline transporter-like protein n=1 Tax=Stephanodiscus triporus TaxID=2934178 RepID=A0ABD3PTF3_9STRA
MGRGQQEEQPFLDAPLIDSENNDDVGDPSYYHGNNATTVVGVRQPTRCRDSWAAMLFYGQLAGVAAVAGILGAPAIVGREGVDDDGSSSSSSSGAGLLYGFVSFVLSGLSLLIMSAFPKFLIQLSLLSSLAWSLAVAVSSFLLLPSPANVVGGAVGISLFLLSTCYALVVWRRIPYASSNLETGLSAIRANAGSVLVACAMIAISIGYTILWMAAFVGVYDREEGSCAAYGRSAEGEGSDGTTGGEVVVCEDGLAWGYLFLLLLAYFWTEQVFQNTIHVVIAGVVSTWWFAPGEASSFCYVAIRDSFVRATTTSFGSICFGSLLVAIIETLRAIVESARSDPDNDGCAAFLLCIVDCLLSCLEGTLEYFNKFAYIYVGMYGYGYLEAGKNVMTLFRQRGWTIIIADNLVSNVLSLFVVVIGVVTGCVGLLMNDINPSWFEGFEGTAMGVAFGFSFLVGIVISAILLSVVDSSINTVLVCFAEAPGEFEENHPELSSNMRDAWRKVYPIECGF